MSERLVLFANVHALLYNVLLSHSSTKYYFCNVNNIIMLKSAVFKDIRRDEYAERKSYIMSCDADGAI